MKILVLGSTGYVGGRLVPRLLERGHNVRCLVRDPRKAQAREWAKNTEIFSGDVLDADSLGKAVENIDVIYYLIHSMASGTTHFEELDRKAAQNVASLASRAKVRRIIYLGGLGTDRDELSAHLRSRREVGNILRKGEVPVTEFRAAVIVGSGSLSFEMIHHLVNRLPMMICPQWVYTRTQPIAVGDILRYLVEALDKKQASAKVIDVGGPDIMSYRDMMLGVADLLGLRRLIFPVPLLTPRLSSYWVNLVTPIQTHVARALIDSLRHETVCENNLAGEIFDFKPLSFKESARLALGQYAEGTVESTWTDASSHTKSLLIDSSHLRHDRRELKINAPPQSVFNVITSIGGENGWYFGNWLWKLRGFIDKQLGGVGLRRGRKNATTLKIGDALDFWRVADFEEGRMLLLRAEMKVWGEALLEFIVEPDGTKGSLIKQTAKYYPKGLRGLMYWYSLYPIHVYVFRGLIRAIGRRAEAAANQA